MLAAKDLRSILDAAEQAVSREDAASAERLLREALALQETTPGSPRDEIAKTLNNLAVVCEMTGKLKDAETCYRRAFTIATASLPASDPFVTTSRENLEAFCKAQDIPLVPQLVAQPAAEPPRVAEPVPVPASAPAPAPKPAPAPPRVAPPPPQPTRAKPVPAPPPPRVTPPTRQPSRVASAVPAETHRGSRTILIVVALVAAVVVAMVLARWLTRPSVAERAETIAQSEPVTSVPPDVPAPAATPSPAPPPEPTPKTEPVATAPTPTAPTPAAPAPEPPRATASSAGTTVVSAQVCRSLTTTGAWRCETATGPQAPGRLTFYTRVASARDTVVEHRWYRDDRLYQRVELRIRANPDGFRTYSRNTIGPDRTGQWKVELRASDGRLLHEETFVVQ